MPRPNTEPLLEGSMGDVIDFEGAPEVTGSPEYGYTYLDVRTRGTGWVVMTGLSFRGTLGEGELAPGAVLTLDESDFEGWVEPAMTMIGCSGPLDDVWEYDCSPQEVEVQIHEGRTDGELLLDVAATFDPDCGGDDIGLPPDWDGEPPIAQPAPADDTGAAPQPVDATFYVIVDELRPRYGSGGPIVGGPTPAPPATEPEPI